MPIYCCPVKSACKAIKMSAQGIALGLWCNGRMRPKGAKDLCFSAFALTERRLPRHFNTQGVALG